MSPEFRYLKIDRDGQAAIVSLNNPSSLNALNADMIHELGTLFAWLKNEMRIGAVVVRGEGRTFAAGADIRQMEKMTPDEAQEYSRLGSGVFGMIEHFPLPVIAAVNGYALGGGLELMLSCDIAYAEAGAKFGLPETTLGLIPGFGGSMRLARRIGLHRAKELIFTGRMIGTDEALRMGLINRVTEADALMESVMELVVEIGKASPNAVKTVKPILDCCADSASDKITAMEISRFGSVFAHHDARAGMSAFVAKSKPEWETDH